MPLGDLGRGVQFLQKLTGGAAEGFRIPNVVPENRQEGVQFNKVDSTVGDVGLIGRRIGRQSPMGKLASLDPFLELVIPQRRSHFHATQPPEPVTHDIKEGAAKFGQAAEVHSRNRDRLGARLQADHQCTGRQVRVRQHLF